MNDKDLEEIFKDMFEPIPKYNSNSLSNGDIYLKGVSEGIPAWQAKQMKQEAKQQQLYQHQVTGLEQQSKLTDISKPFSLFSNKQAAGFLKPQTNNAMSGINSSKAQSQLNSFGKPSNKLNKTAVNTSKDQHRLLSDTPISGKSLEELEGWHAEKSAMDDSFPPLNEYLKNPELYSDEHKDAIKRDAVSRTKQGVGNFFNGWADSYYEQIQREQANAERIDAEREADSAAATALEQQRQQYANEAVDALFNMGDDLADDQYQQILQDQADEDRRYSELAAQSGAERAMEQENLDIFNEWITSPEVRNEVAGFIDKYGRPVVTGVATGAGAAAGSAVGPAGTVAGGALANVGSNLFIDAIVSAIRTDKKYASEVDALKDTIRKSGEYLTEGARNTLWGQGISGIVRKTLKSACPNLYKDSVFVSEMLPLISAEISTIMLEEIE